MDYVVFGIGFGATLLVLGLLVRDLGPRVRFRRPTHPDGVFHAEELVARVSWSRFCGALGTVLAIAGVIFILITAICMALMTSDDTAGAIMLGSLTLLCVLMALWTWAFFDRFGSYGILPEREDTPVPPDSASPDSASTTSVQPAQDSSPAKDTVLDQEETTTLDTTSSTTSPDEVAYEPGDTPDTSPTDHSTPDNEPNQQPLPTPEERMAATTPIDHESLEAELDMPVPSHARPRRRNDRSTDSAGTPDETFKDRPDQ